MIGGQKYIGGETLDEMDTYLCRVELFNRRGDKYTHALVEESI